MCVTDQSVSESRALKLITLLNQAEKNVADLKHAMVAGCTPPGGTAVGVPSTQHKVRLKASFGLFMGTRSFLALLTKGRKALVICHMLSVRPSVCPFVR